MPQDEVQTDARLYSFLERALATSEETAAAINDAVRFSYEDSNPSHLTPAQLTEEIELTKIALMKHYNHGIALTNVSDRYPDFAPRLTQAELGHLAHRPDPSNLDALAPAHALTMTRLKAAGYVPTRLTPDGWVPIEGDSKTK